MTATVASAVPAQLSVVSYAHRGASAHAPENTLAAFALAAHLGANAVELDIRRTLDGHLVISHDATLARTTDVARVYPERVDHPVESFTLAELRRLDAGGWHSPAYAGERVPTLAEAMDLLAGHGLGLLLEAKEPARYPGMAGQIAHALRTVQPRWLRMAAAGRLTVESFDWDFVRELRAVLPRVAVGLLGAPDVDALAGLAGFADQINPAHATLTAEYVEAVHQYGMAVNTWTVDDPAEMVRVLGAGVDGVISNCPDRLASVVQTTAAVA